MCKNCLVQNNTHSRIQEPWWQALAEIQLFGCVTLSRTPADVRRYQLQLQWRIQQYFFDSTDQLYSFFSIPDNYKDLRERLAGPRVTSQPVIIPPHPQTKVVGVENKTGVACNISRILDPPLKLPRWDKDPPLLL